MSTTGPIGREEPSALIFARWQTAEYLRRLLTAFLEAFGWFEAKREKRRSRRLLMDLTNSQLRDIGLSRADVVNEARRRFWDWQ